jgi:hypothetical protein
MLFMQIIIKCQFWCWVLKDIPKTFVQPSLFTSTKLMKCDIDFFPKKQVKVVEFTLKGHKSKKKSNFLFKM